MSAGQSDGCSLGLSGVEETLSPMGLYMYRYRCEHPGTSPGMGNFTLCGYVPCMGMEANLSDSNKFLKMLY